MKDHKHIEITVTDEFVELGMFDCAIKFDLRLMNDDDYLLHLPLPRYMPEIAIKMVRKMRTEHVSVAFVYLTIEHEDWCAKCTEDDFSIPCSCNPVLRDHTIEVYNTGENKTLTCTECGESSTGNVEIIDDDHEYYTKLGVWKDGHQIKVFWRGLDDPDPLICADCSSRNARLIGELKIPTPSETDDDQKANK